LTFDFESITLGIMKGLVITPTYKEEESILQHLISIKTYSEFFDILIVDDDSPDGTSKIVTDFAINNTWVKLINNGKKDGLGNAYKTGFNFALENNYPYVIQMDADGSHSSETLLQFKKHILNYDLVIGSRYIKYGRILNWSLYRRVLSKVGNLIGRSVTQYKVKDVTGGFKAIRATSLEKLDFSKMETKGYAFQIDLLRMLIGSDIQLIEIPITFQDRLKGQSKMSRGIVIEAFKRVLIWKIKDLSKLTIKSIQHLKTQ
jgi:dolichol-phosphate mannosyltransferase